jgi:hypothetical protein
MTVFSPRTIKHRKGIERHPIGLIQKMEKKHKESQGNAEVKKYKRLLKIFRGALAN